MLVGTCSWTDRTLVAESDFYPRRSMSAEERLGFYASQFPVVEVDATYYFPPTEELAGRWVERTPEGFTFDVKAYSLLTGHPTKPGSLWPDVAAQLTREGKASAYLSHLPEEAVAVAYRRFREALLPLYSAGKLGFVLFQFPPWFGPGSRSRRHLEDVRRHMGDYDVAVEFRTGAWFAEGTAERTLSLLRDLGFAHVCVDEPQGFRSSVPVVVAATSDLAVVRFHGRNAETWEARVPTAAERFNYRYPVEELAEWVPHVARLRQEAGEVHLLMNNCYRDHAVANGRELAALLGLRIGPAPA